MRFERRAYVWGDRRVQVDAWATRQRPLCLFALHPTAYLLNDGISLGLTLCVFGVGLKLATYPWPRKDKS